MVERRRARADQSARRVNAAEELLARGFELADAARRLARRYRVSERQARRYLETARESGPVPIPRPKVVFTVKVDRGLDRRIRGHARATGHTISGVVSQALEEFLERARAGRLDGTGA